MNDNRPVNLDLSTIRLPLTAVVSILTRISGVINFVAMAILIWLLDLSLSGQAGFEQAQAIMAAPLAKLVIWAIAAGIIYHSLAGIKHLVADFGYGETLEGGILGAQLVLVVSIVLIVLAGVWIW